MKEPLAEMAKPITVKVSKRNQIAVPAQARQILDIKSGDRLLVDIQDGIMVLIPWPDGFMETMAGLHQEVWEGVDVQSYIDAEREAWTDS